MAVELVEPVKRVEQYLYALCVMDFSNIPIPRSRLEFFAHALITGVLPEFQAETREEVYITAIVTGDYANLPLPKSRADQLLYKICLGETEIRDIELETRYEMLLAFIAEHGDMSLETVLVECVNALQTIPNTVEMPVQRAILKGQTLVNLVTQKSGSFNGTRFLRIPLSYTLKTNAKYFVKFNVRESSLTDGVVCRLKIGTNGNVVGGLESDGIITVTGDGYNYIEFYIKNADDVTNGLDGIVDDIMVIEYQDNMENWDIPYFEGMQSVKMPVLTTTGKNLLNPSWEKEYGKFYPFKLKKGTTLTLSTKDSTPSLGGNLLFTTVSGREKWFAMDAGATKNTITLDEDVYQVDNILTGDIEYQLEIGSQATSYEPYKSNTLTVNEPVELRGIGDVQDELNLMVGELTQRVSSLECINQKSKLSQSGTSNDSTLVITSSLQSTSTLGGRKLVSSHELIKYAQLDSWYGALCIIFRLPKSNENFATLANFKQYLTQNPFYYYRELEQNEISIKTVDLSIVDQDGNAVPCLSTFNDATHVSINAVDIIPQVDLEVRVDANTMANVASQQENVAVAQASLSDAIDAQNDDIEMTKQALDEVKGE